MSRTDIARAHAHELTGAWAVAAVAGMIGALFAGSTVLTPLYVIYKRELDFSQITLTLIYAAYVLGNVAALLFVGRISDAIGRRIIALAATVILFVAALVFLFADGIAALYVARILSGLGIGIASGSANAWLAELVANDNNKDNKAKAATIGTSSNFLGLGIAALASGLLAQYAPWPLHLSFVIYLVILCAVALLVWFCQETVPSPEMGKLSLRPTLAVPRNIRAQFVAPAITGFGLMALVGFYAALMPTILSQDLGIHNHAAGGALLFELAIVVAFVIVATQALDSRLAMLWSLALMIPAAGTMTAAQASASLWVMLAATAGVGVSAGLGYRGSLQVVNQIAPAEKRAAVVSSYFVCCFIGNALPVIGVGVLSSFTRSIVADVAFACVISAFALVALIFGLAQRR